jgi:DNA adenine methylase
MIRYPGSKDKIARAIIQRFPDHLRLGGLFSEWQFEYREPFFGAGAVGFAVMRRLQMVGPAHTLWINDRDYGIRCLWGAVYDVPVELSERVRSFVPSVDTFYRFRDEDGRRDLDPLESGFRKLVLHQTSFSGLGVKAGGPIGGRKQSSAYNVDCRWNPSRLCRDIAETHQTLRRFARFKVTASDFTALIVNAPAHAFIYADPPYVDKGPDLYKHSLSEADHERLASALFHCQAPWVLSYDDHPLVRRLYSWARIESVHLTYTTAVASSGKRRKNSEVIISRHPVDLEKARTAFVGEVVAR